METLSLLFAVDVVVDMHNTPLLSSCIVRLKNNPHRFSVNHTESPGLEMKSTQTLFPGQCSAVLNNCEPAPRLKQPLLADENLIQSGRAAHILRGIL